MAFPLNEAAFEESFMALSAAMHEDDESGNSSLFESSFSSSSDGDVYELAFSERDLSEVSEGEAHQEEKCYEAQRPSSPFKPSRGVLSLDMVRLLCGSSCKSERCLLPGLTQSSIKRSKSFRLQKDELPRRGRDMVYVIQTESPIHAPNCMITEDCEGPNPLAVFRTIMEKNNRKVDIRPYGSCSFVRGKTSSYSTELIDAARKGDFSLIRSMHQAGTNLQCGNRFGETLMHSVARRGNFDILRYLVEEARVSVRVACDGGRTPLHDAAWSATPNFQCIRYLLSLVPEFLLVADRRGTTPLEYCPRSTHAVWATFLEEHSHLYLSPKETSDFYLTI